MTTAMTMTTITNWLSPEVLRPAGWALLHLVWQGTALAALAAGAMSLLRRASARYLVAVGVLVAMLAAPVATFFAYRNAKPGQSQSGLFESQSDAMSTVSSPGHTIVKRSPARMT